MLPFLPFMYAIPKNKKKDMLINHIVLESLKLPLDTLKFVTSTCTNVGQCIDNANTVLNEEKEWDVVKFGFYLNQCGAFWDPIVAMAMAKELCKGEATNIEAKYKKLNQAIEIAGLTDFHAVKPLIDGKII